MSNNLFGRSAELDQALRVLRRVGRGGGGAVIVLAGEPGIGKTVLLDEVREQARRLEFCVRGAAVGRHQDIPLAPLLLVLRSTDDPLLSSDQLKELTRLRDQPVWLWERVAAVLERRAADRPVTVSLDDAHWLDQATLSAMRVLFQRLAGSPVVWLLTTQTAPGGPVEELVRECAQIMPTHRIPLGPLPLEAITAVAVERLGRDPDGRTRGLLVGAGGNPSLAVELANALSAERPPGTDPQLLAGTDQRPAPLPMPLLESIHARLGRVMGQPETRLLQAGAVLGSSFTLEGAGLLLGEPPQSLMPRLQEALRLGFVADNGESISFRHDLVRRALYEYLPPSSRRIMHRAVASSLLAARRPAIEVAPHFLESASVGDKRAVSVLCEAACSIVESAPSRAAQFFGGAMRLAPPDGPQRWDLGRQTVEAMARAGDVGEAIALGERLLAEAEVPETQAQMVVALAPAWWASERVDMLRSQIERVAEVDSLSDSTRVRLLACHALARSHGQQADHDGTVAREALAQAQQLADPCAESIAHWALGEAALHDGRHAEAVVHLSARRRLEGRATTAEVIARLHLDDYDMGAEMLHEVGREVAERRTSEPTTSVLAAQATLHLRVGALDAAGAAADALRLGSERLGDHSRRALAGGLLGEVARLRGDLVAGRRHLEAARAVVGGSAHAVLLDQVEALLLIEDGDSSGAASLLRNGTLGALWHRHRWSRDWIVAAVRIGVQADDLDVANEAASLAEDYASRNASSVGALAAAQHARGLLSDDVELLAQAVRRLEDASRPLVRAELHRDHGEALLRAGRCGEAIAALDASWNLFGQVGAVGSARRVQRLLHSAGAHRKRSSGPRATQGWAALTPAEMKVARLIADGRTNRDAAAALVLSPHTISTHLRAVFSKLGVNSRVQLTRIVMGES